MNVSEFIHLELSQNEVSETRNNLTEDLVSF